jgi:hypothetical protein
MSNSLNDARKALLEQLKRAARDIPDWGVTPAPNEWLLEYVRLNEETESNA